jgi:hypothetical protein
MIPVVGDYTLSDIKILGVHNWTPSTMVNDEIPGGYTEGQHPVSKERAIYSWQMKNNGNLEFQYYCKNSV